MQPLSSATSGAQARGSDKLPYRFPISLRLVAVGIVFVAAATADGLRVGSHLGYALQYFAAILISVAISFGGWLLAANAGFAGLWLLELVADASPHARGLPVSVSRLVARAYAPFDGAITWINRTLGHLEAYGVWSLLVLLWFHELRWQMAALAAIHFVAEPLLNYCVWTWLHREARRYDAPVSMEDGTLHWARRPFINLAAIAGTLVVLWSAPEQRDTTLPFALAMSGGAALRLVKWLLADRLRRGGQDLEIRKRRLTAQGNHARIAARFDTPVLLAVSLLVAVGFLRARDVWRDKIHPESRPTLGWSQRPVACQADANSEIAEPDITAFVLADTQIHKLDGDRFPGQLGLAEAIVPVARRPIELDLLSEATLWGFAPTYRQLQTRFDKPVPWLYLGDLIDLACESEMQAALDALGPFGFDQALGIAPGNHDSSFTGNFVWSPYWSRACGRLLDKDRSDAQLHTSEYFGRGTETFQGRQLYVPGKYLASVVPMGTTRHHGAARAVFGVFLDTTDRFDFDYGIAGVVGTLSDQQVAAIVDAATKLAAASPDTPPAYVMFTHHPVTTLDGPRRARLANLVDALEPRRSDGRAHEPTVLGFVAAHTHRAQRGELCLNDRRLQSLVVGSTVDPPQEAAVLHVGADVHGRAAMSITTVPAVARTDMTCTEAPVPAAETCQVLVGRLAEQTACRPLLERDDGHVGLDCRELEQATRTLANVREVAGPKSPDSLDRTQTHRAEQLFACLCRDDRCETRPGRDYFERERLSATLHRIAESEGGADELACLGWAASAVQAHKARGMEIADALRCSFDDHSIQPAQRMVAALEVRTCD